MFISLVELVQATLAIHPGSLLVVPCLVALAFVFGRISAGKTPKFGKDIGDLVSRDDQLIHECQLSLIDIREAAKKRSYLRFAHSEPSLVAARDHHDRLAVSLQVNKVSLRRLGLTVESFNQLAVDIDRNIAEARDAARLERDDRAPEFVPAASRPLVQLANQFNKGETDASIDECEDITAELEDLAIAEENEPTLVRRNPLLPSAGADIDVAVDLSDFNDGAWAPAPDADRVTDTHIDTSKLNPFAWTKRSVSGIAPKMPEATEPRIPTHSDVAPKPATQIDQTFIDDLTSSIDRTLKEPRRKPNARPALGNLIDRT